MSEDTVKNSLPLIDYFGSPDPRDYSGKGLVHDLLSRMIVQEYLDECIIYWREQLKLGMDTKCIYMIDAFQSVRTTLLGSTLEKKD